MAWFYPEQMMANLKQNFRGMFRQVLLAPNTGITREEAYKIVQFTAMKVGLIQQMQGRTILPELEADPFVH